MCGVVMWLLVFQDHGEPRRRACCLLRGGEGGMRWSAAFETDLRLPPAELLPVDIDEDDTRSQGEVYVDIDFDSELVYLLCPGITPTLILTTWYHSSHQDSLLDYRPRPSFFLLGHHRYIPSQPVNSSNALTKSVCHHAVALNSLLLVTDLRMLLVTIRLREDI